VANLLNRVDGTCVVLVNAEGQHSPWPVPLYVPAGRTVAHTADRPAEFIYCNGAAWAEAAVDKDRYRVQ
jgi:uncharacterized protein YbdZ (MbtH family)